MMAYGFDAIEHNGVLVFRIRTAQLYASVDSATLVYEKGTEGAIELTRTPEVEISAEAM
jgi:hypothetical protein